jgi:sulfonate transport system substrate-binding protein
MKTTLRSFIILVLALLALPNPARADAPSEIRIFYPGVGVGNRPAVQGNAVAVMHLRGMLEEEFKNDGIQISWSFLRGAGPAVNESYANGLVDFNLLGDLPSIVGLSSGLDYKVLAATSTGGDSYISVPADSSIREPKDLKGKRVAVQKGTAGHLTAVKILETLGLSERDVRLVNMDSNTARAAIVTGDLDAAFGGSDYFSLRDQGAARIIYSTRGQNPALTSNSLFFGSSKFIAKYPEHTQRVVKTLVLAAKWLADNERAPEVVYQLWTRSGSTFASLKESWQGQSFKNRLSPLIDPYVHARYKFQIEQANRLGLVRKTFELAPSVDDRFLTSALTELGLQTFWQPRDATTGKPAEAVAIKN